MAELLGIILNKAAQHMLDSSPDPIASQPQRTDLPELPLPLVLRQLERDLRLYVPHAAGWEAHIMDHSSREYCHSQTPGQDYFHLLLPGEIYLQYGHVKYCLNCAYRLTRITDDRLYWQRGVRQRPEPL